MRKLLRRFVAAPVVAGAMAVALPAVVAPLAASVSVFAAETDVVNITIADSDGGKVISNLEGEVSRDNQLTLSAVPDEGYRFAGWIFQNEYNDYAFITNDYSNANVNYDLKEYREDRTDIYVEAVFVKVTESNPDKVHNIINNYGSSNQIAYEGEEITLSDGAGTLHYKIVRLNDGVDVTKELLGMSKYGSYSYSFSMPTYDIGISLSSYASGYAAYVIINDSPDLIDVPDEGEVGDTVSINPLDPYKKIKITILNDRNGQNVTSELLRSEDVVSFVMPDYPIKISAIDVTNAHSVNVVTNYRVESESDDPETEFGYIMTDKSSTEPGEQVTVRAVDGTNASFARRYFTIIRNSDGENVTEQLLGERIFHDPAGETFTMPDYDITISGDMYQGYIGTPPVPPVIGTEHSHPVELVQSEGGSLIPVSGLETHEGILTTVDKQERDDVVIKAVPEPGYRFVKWYVYDLEYGVGSTETSVKSSVNSTEENGVTSVTANIDPYNYGFRVSAVFEATDSRNIYIEKNDEKVNVKLDKSVAKVGESVHIGVDSADADEPDLSAITVTRNDTGEKIFVKNDFFGHAYSWEGDLYMPDSDVTIEVATWKWAPELPAIVSFSLEQTNGGTISIDKDFGDVGDVITLSNKPDEGYTFVKWVVTDGDGNVVTEQFVIGEDGTFKVTEDMLRRGFTISAEFTKVKEASSGAAGSSDSSVKGDKASVNAGFAAGGAVASGSSGTANVVPAAVASAAVQTGDRDNTVIFAGAAAVATVAGVGAVVRKRKKE